MSILRTKFIKDENMKYISHLDLMRLFQRAFRRADIPVKYSEGFNPHPKFSFATALSLGTSSHGEYMDVELDRNIKTEVFIDSMNNTLPQGIKILKAEYIDNSASIMSLIRWSTYIIELKLSEDTSQDTFSEELQKLLDLNEIIIVKEKKKGKRIVVKEEDVRKRIKEIHLLNKEDNIAIIKATLMTGSLGNLKPEKLVEILSHYTEIKIDIENVKIHRLELFMEQDDNLVTPI